MSLLEFFSPFFVCVNSFVTKCIERCECRIDVGKSLGKARDMFVCFFKGFYAYYKIIFQIICTNLDSHGKGVRESIPLLICQKSLTFKNLVHLISKKENLISVCIF